MLGPGRGIERRATGSDGDARDRRAGGRRGVALAVVLLLGVAGPIGLAEGVATGSTAAGHSAVAPLSLANFVIVDPYGHATAHQGPVELALGSGGPNLSAFDSVGYRFGFADAARGLHPGLYSTAVDAWIGMTNDPACLSGTTSGAFVIDQATYDPAGQLSAFGARFSFSCFTGTRVSGTIAYQLSNTTPGQGYYVFGTSGGVAGFGNDNYLAYLGDPVLLGLGVHVVGMAPTQSGNGYWMVAADGGIFAFGDAGFAGSMGGRPLVAPIVGMAPTPSGNGYWLVAADGGIFAFGDAVFSGSTGTAGGPGGVPGGGPVAGMAR